jgi:HSP20 family protein
MARTRRERFPELFQGGMPEVFRRFADFDQRFGWMRVEEFADQGSLVVRVEMPGIDPDKDVDLSVSNGVLHIRAQREERAETKEQDVYRSEFRYGSFERRVQLPAGAGDRDVSATYKDGILEVRVPLPEQPEASVTKVPVSRG